MATPPPATLPESFGVTRLAGARASPSTAKGGSSLREEAIWKRLREAGFDEETVKRRDKAALITYVTRLEAEKCSERRLLEDLLLLFFLCLVGGALACVVTSQGLFVFLRNRSFK
ncbi:Putative nuclear matrix constituent protein 1-like protein [Dendrobium catenatum]|uniref:Nuclear matrix constituent protein 1-like protein n=1 Tax=Dendrobium catenatum TaxID=906689 RepID=A0A2I0WKQ2_9ASPA|nr:Putative nuclear matrix constituent protein 1-like protein [Dendrobium catenatum]